MPSVWHDALARFLSAAPDPPSTNGDHDIIIAVITVGGPFLLGVVGLIINGFITRSRSVPLPVSPPIPLNSNDDDELDVVEGRLKVLERWIWLQGVDPNRIKTGDEVITDVRFK